MDINQTLISAGISIASYIIYKIAQRYYIKSGCHDSTIEITIVDKELRNEIPESTNPQVESVSQHTQKNNIQTHSEC